MMGKESTKFIHAGVRTQNLYMLPYSIERTGDGGCLFFVDAGKKIDKLRWVSMYQNEEENMVNWYMVV